MPFYNARNDCRQSGAARARATSARAAPPRKREPVQWRTSALLSTRASHPTKCEPGLVRGSTALHRRRTASRFVVPFCGARNDCRKRGAARASATSARAAPPPQREPAQWRPSAQARYTRKPPHEVRAMAGTWEHGLAPKKGGFSLVQCPSMVHGTIAASAARRARATSARATPPPQREPAQWRASALHAPATSRSDGQG